MPSAVKRSQADNPSASAWDNVDGILTCIKVPVFSTPGFSLADYGVVGDGVEVNTVDSETARRVQLEDRKDCYER